MRTAEELQKLTAETFIDFDVNITPITLSFNAAPSILAREAAGFFYASFVLSRDDFSHMLTDLEKYFITKQQDGISCFTMPVNRLVVSGRGGK